MILKPRPLSLTVLAAVLSAACGAAHATKSSGEEVILRAMRDELNRNVKRLELSELERPFFIGYGIRDFEFLTASATLGASVYSSQKRIRDHGVRVLVGDYSFNDENFLDFTPGSFGSSSGGNASVPLENDYAGIRRALWIATDAVYKRAAESFERKKAAIAQQRLSKEVAELADFSKAAPVKAKEAPRTFPLDRARWEEAARKLSAVFLDYPEIFSSRVRVSVSLGRAYTASSEGTEVTQPVSYVGVQIAASTQAIDGSPLSDVISFHATTPDGLPALSEMTRSAKQLADQLVALRKAERFEGSYAGPVLFEGQGVAELLVQRLFTGANGLLAYRRPVVSDSRAGAYLRRMEGESLVDRIGKRILPRDVSITARPHLKDALGRQLIGTTRIDADGIRPPKEIVLVREGKLQGMLSNRTPTLASVGSNGHQKFLFGAGGVTGHALGPSVVEISSNRGRTESELEKKLFELAEEEGLDYALIVRRLAGAGRRRDPGRGPSVGLPILLYKVDLKTGRETMLRAASLGAIGVGSLRQIVGVAKKMQLYETLAAGSRGGGRAFGRSAGGQGVAASFILPEALLFEELEVGEEKSDYVPRLPVVASPLLSE